jgi:glycosyltransferase involved in cell wall biosynthesis
LKTSPHLALLTNLPAPYRVPVWNHLARLTGGKLEVRFIAPDDPRQRSWTVPSSEMHFRWEFLSHAPKGGVSTPPFQATAHQHRSGALPAALIELRAALAILRFLLRRRPRAVICGGYNSLAAWVTFAWCRVTRRRFVLWLEGTTRDLRPPGRLKTWLKKLIVARAGAIAASGNATVEYVRALGASANRIFPAPFGGDYRWFAREAAAVDAAAEKERRGYPSRLVLYSGRLVREKGVMVLLEAFRRLAPDIPDAGLLVVGDGPARAEMESFCRGWNIPRVFFAGVQEYHRMPHFYALADVLVLPTFSDTWGYVVNEAFACGVPAIVSRVAGVCDDLIMPGVTGFTVEPGDAEALAAKMRLLLIDTPLRSRMGANCRRAIVPYSAEACAEGLLAAVEGRNQEKQKAEGRNQSEAVLISSF